MRERCWGEQHHQAVAITGDKVRAKWDCQIQIIITSLCLKTILYFLLIYLYITVDRIQKISVPISDTKKAPLTHRSEERGISEPERECTLWSRLVVLRGRGSSTSVHCGFETGRVILLVRAGLGRGLSDGSQPGCQLAPLFKGYSNVRLQQWAHSMTSLFVKIDYFK
jgi:hypothetical protein